MPFANAYDFSVGFWAAIYPIHKCQMQDCGVSLKHTCCRLIFAGCGGTGVGKPEAVCG